MRHRKQGRQLRRTSEQRLALLRNLATSLIENGAIETTEAKAKELRPHIEKLVTRARKDTVANRRLVAARLGDDDAVNKLFTAIAPRYAEREGGYTRIVKRAATATDGRKTAYIAFV